MKPTISRFVLLQYIEKISSGVSLEGRINGNGGGEEWPGRMFSGAPQKKETAGFCVYRGVLPFWR
jgi:hypothetical protein